LVAAAVQRGQNHVADCNDLSQAAREEGQMPEVPAHSLHYQNAWQAHELDNDDDENNDNEYKNDCRYMLLCVPLHAHNCTWMGMDGCEGGEEMRIECMHTGVNNASGNVHGMSSESDKKGC